MFTEQYLNKETAQSARIHNNEKQ